MGYRCQGGLWSPQHPNGVAAEEFAALLREVGFVDVRVTANYDDDASPGARDRDWSFRARKP